MSRSKCIIILSEKSSGSSACQNLLARFADIKHVENTRHGEHETLYWVKAASILGRPQMDMLDSEVPISATTAKADLCRLLVDNVEHPNLPKDDSELVFDGWRQLCSAHAPIFVEKSPHHLCQWSAIELIAEAQERVPEVEFFVVGLVRNPMDTLYSQFQRWGTPPERLQYQWATAYSNLLKLKKITAENLLIVRYEDMVASIHCLKPVFEFCGVEVGDEDERFFHNRSIAKFRKDRRFGFVLSDEVAEVAKVFGYSDDDLRNDPWRFWPVYRRATRFWQTSTKFFKNTVKVVLAGRQRKDTRRSSGTIGNL